MPAIAAPGTTAYTLPTDTQIVAVRVFDAPRRVVFEAWTNPEHIPRWLTGPDGWTMPVCEIDARPGGSWRYVWRKEDGREMEMSGIVKEIVPYERFVTTERWGPEWPESLNTLELTEVDGRTLTTLTMTYASREVRDMAYKTGMTGGMDTSFARLDGILGSIA